MADISREAVEAAERAFVDSLCPATQSMAVGNRTRQEALEAAITAALPHLLAAPQPPASRSQDSLRPPNGVCNKCGYCGPVGMHGEHSGCSYLAPIVPAGRSHEGDEAERLLTEAAEYIAATLPEIDPRAWAQLLAYAPRSQEGGMREALAATVKETAGGPTLFIAGVRVRDWLGCFHDAEARALAASINAALALCGGRGG